MWELDYKESWALKNWCFWTVVLKTLESALDCREIQSVHPKGDQSWVFIGRTDVEAETPILWPTDVKSWLTWKDPDAGKDRRQEEKGISEGEMVGWHHRLNGHGFGWAPGVGDGQGGLECCGSWGCKESDTTERLTTAQSRSRLNNWTELITFNLYFKFTQRESCIESQHLSINRVYNFSLFPFIISLATIKILLFTHKLKSYLLDSFLGERNGNPLQYSLLENHMDRGAW